MKPYVKPELFYESFEMNQSIAACAFDLNQAENSCRYEGDPAYGLAGESVFTDSLSCTYTKEMADVMEIYCYQNAESAKRLWNS